MAYGLKRDVSVGVGTMQSALRAHLSRCVIGCEKERKGERERDRVREIERERELCRWCMA